MTRYKININFGKKVKKFRKFQNLSQEQMAEQLKVSRNHIGRIERGEVNINLVLAQKIGRLLKTQASDLISF
ncbi:MAG: helix-turn-helix transcriptional regulator [Patescibacteria group bacterium]